MAFIKAMGKFVKIEDFTKDIKNFHIELDRDIEFEAGQYVSLLFFEDGKKHSRLYSIASPPDSKRIIELCIKLVEGGMVTPVLFGKDVGHEVNILGPLGKFTLKDSRENVVFIGVGTGVAPFRSMIIDEIRKGSNKNILLIYGVRYEEDLLYQEEFARMSNENENFKYVNIISRPAEDYTGLRGHVQDHFGLINNKDCDLYICGVRDMIIDSKNKLLDIGFKEESIRLENYG